MIENKIINPLIGNLESSTNIPQSQFFYESGSEKYDFVNGKLNRESGILFLGEG